MALLNLFLFIIQLMLMSADIDMNLYRLRQAQEHAPSSSWDFTWALTRSVLCIGDVLGEPSLAQAVLLLVSHAGERSWSLELGARALSCHFPTNNERISLFLRCFLAAACDFNWVCVMGAAVCTPVCGAQVSKQVMNIFVSGS